MYCYLNNCSCKYANAQGCCDSTACHNTNILGNIGNINNYSQAKENRPNPWHTGTPTDVGWYVCKLRDSDLYETHYFTNNNWDEKMFEKWQKIEEE